jgi:hypothetical protein
LYCGGFGFFFFFFFQIGESRAYVPVVTGFGCRTEYRICSVRKEI